MSRRFVLPLAVLGSISLAAGLVPALAEAATPAHGAAARSATATASSSLAAKAGSAGVRMLRAPVTTSHHLHESVTGATANDPNPNLAAEFDSGDIGAFTFTFNASVSGYTTTTSGGLSATVEWGDGTTSNYSDVSTSPSYSHQYGSTGVYSVTLIVSDGAGDAASSTWSGVQTEGSEYTPYPPTRILDTRKGIGAPESPLAAKGTLKLQVGNVPIPEPYGITAVVLNVTATKAAAGGFLSVYGDDDSGGTPVPLPQTSNLNFAPGKDVANLVIVPVGSNGIVDFYNGAPGSVGVIADVQGYFSVTEVNKYVGVAPTRVLDTRKGIGTNVVAKIPANGNVTLTLPGAGKGVIPTAARLSAVALNLTVTNPTSVGNITAYPAGETQPVTSNVNYVAGQTVANSAIVPVGTKGQVVFHNNSTGSVDLIADATGYFTAGQVAGGNAYVPFSAPIRELDTRPGSLAYGTPTPFYPGYDNSATSAVYNATVTKPTSGSFLALYPYDPQTPNALPTTSTLNFNANDTVANLAIVPIGTVPDTSFNPPAYEIAIYLNGKGTAQVILDLFGFFDDK